MFQHANIPVHNAISFTKVEAGKEGRSLERDAQQAHTGVWQ